ncbi:MAG TPA: ABC transporter ATP-binding protein [Gemmatimonadaceae bacterium]|nr:ABC transporter ATP-binding protein [Gemmatimonadaceae bacterium]
MTDAIIARNVTYRAGREFAIRDLSMNVPSGSVYGFLGPNGSGKTTTLRLILGMLPIEDGTIDLLGHDVPKGVHKALAKIGYVPERLHLYPQLTVEETLRYHAAFYADWDHARAESLRREFALRAEQPVDRLSKGESGKLMMLVALAHNPQLLVLDEPTDGLDPVVRRDVLAALLEYVSSRSATVLISSHLIHEQERICDHVGVMDGGRLLAEMPMAAFRGGIKRLRVARAPLDRGTLPFTLLSRGVTAGREEEWIVRGWQPAMREYFSAAESELREVIDLDLEESFVELLRSARKPAGVSGEDN